MDWSGRCMQQLGLLLPWLSLDCGAGPSAGDFFFTQPAGLSTSSSHQQERASASENEGGKGWKQDKPGLEANWKTKHSQYYGRTKRTTTTPNQKNQPKKVQKDEDNHLQKHHQATKPTKTTTKPRQQPRRLPKWKYDEKTRADIYTSRPLSTRADAALCTLTRSNWAKCGSWGAPHSRHAAGRRKLWGCGMRVGEMKETPSGGAKGKIEGARTTAD